MNNLADHALRFADALDRADLAAEAEQIRGVLRSMDNPTASSSHIVNASYLLDACRGGRDAIHAPHLEDESPRSLSPDMSAALAAMDDLGGYLARTLGLRTN